MTPQIKICGLRTLTDIKIINKYNISYAGFIFANSSKRKISVEQAKEMKKILRSDIKAVGVFTYIPIEEINNIVNYCNLDIIQLHSDETPETCKQAIKPVWKSIAIKSKNSILDINKYLDTAGILLDTYKQGILGGSGEIFNWNIAKNLSSKHFIILAGGLNENNINEAIKIVKPQVVDICSGVETNYIKDEQKIKNLVRRI